ncbi:MAG: hypothetical protein AAF108_05605 [Planctomycetota bacterium]
MQAVGATVESKPYVVASAAPVGARQPAAVSAGAAGPSVTSRREPLASPARRETTASLSAAKPDTQAELQEQYQKVVNLIEKVDKHLDQQDARSQRIMEVVEKFPAETLAKLDGLAGRIDGVGSHLDGISQRQTEMTQSLATVNESISTSMTGLKTSFGELATSTEKLQELLASMKRRDEDRDARLQTHMEHTQKHNEVMEKWMIGMLVLGTLGVAAAIVVAAFVVLSPGIAPPTP